MGRKRLNSQNLTRRAFLTRSLLGAAAGIGAIARDARLPAAAEPRQAQGERGFQPAELAAMEQLAADFMAKYHAPALSIAIAKQGRLVYAHGFGNATEQEALTPRHVFRIASVSKPITSAMIMHLVENGRLKRSDRVFGPKGVLGTEFGRPPYKPYVEELTIDHLLTHTSGGWQNDGSDPMFRHLQMDHKALITWAIENAPLTHAPGAHWAYSNFGYSVLGRVIEKVTGEPYEAAVKKAILKRCGITGMGIAGNTLQDRRPDEVTYEGQGQNPYNMNVTRMDAHGGWLASPTDLVRFAVRMDGFPTVPDILSAETLKTLTTPTAAQGGGGYGRGWSVNSQHNYWHNGSLPGTSTIMVRTSGGFCWAALTNTRVSGIDLALDQLIWNMIGKITVWPARDLFSS